MQTAGKYAAAYLRGGYEKFFAQQNLDRLKAGSTWNDNGFVFCNELGERVSPHTVYHSYKKIVASIGLAKARLHDLRHSYAVAALQAGDDIKTVQGNLGHHTASFTLDAYGHHGADEALQRGAYGSVHSIRLEPLRENTCGKA